MTKGYRDPAVRAYLRRRGTLPVIPTRKDQRSNPRFDRATYRQRNVIERCGGWLKENRQLATRPRQARRQLPGHGQAGDDPPLFMPLA